MVHRCLRDEKKCQAKYGTQWEDYCKEVHGDLFPVYFNSRVI